MALCIEVGVNALDRLQSDDFLIKWNALLNDCPWATAYQAPDFALPWYQLYQNRYSPVIVYMERKNGELVGLMTLALAADGKSLVACGERQAEYQCWLEKPDGPDPFIQDALTELRRRFADARLHLKYLPANTPIEWMRKDCRKNFFFRLRLHSRPLMEIDSINNAKRLRRRNQELNRLKKQGEILFEHVVDPTEFESIFDDICGQYERRLRERYHVTHTPFRDDPLKRPLFIELHKRGLLHATVLRLGGRIVAAHLGLVYKNSLHTCISTHASDLERCSPGKVHFCMLACYLEKEGVSEFDLTPGGGQHKDLYASTRDTVYELHAYASPIGRLAGDIEFLVREVVKSWLSRAGIEPGQVRAALNPTVRS